MNNKNLNNLENCNSCDYCNHCNSCNSCDSCDYCDSCDSCDYCDYCDLCDSCEHCDSCNSCDYCNHCNSCNSCDSCDYCDSCDSCNSCNSCDSCKNLKMTEYNYFCWSEECGSENSFQQPKYRVFNKQVTKNEYHKIKKIYHKLEFDKDEDYDTRFQTAFKKMWDTLSQEEKQEYYNIPHFDWEGFTYITGIEKEEDIQEVTMKEVCEKFGKEVKIKK